MTSKTQADNGRRTVSPRAESENANHRAKAPIPLEELREQNPDRQYVELATAFDDYACHIQLEYPEEGQYIVSYWYGDRVVLYRPNNTDTFLELLEPTSTDEYGTRYEWSVIVPAGSEVFVLYEPDQEIRFKNNSNFRIGPLTDTSKQWNFRILFDGCRDWEGHGLRYIDFSSCTDLTQTFTGCREFTDPDGALTGLELPCCNKFDNPFRDCKSLTLDQSTMKMGWGTQDWFVDPTEYHSTNAPGLSGKPEALYVYNDPSAWPQPDDPKFEGYLTRYVGEFQWDDNDSDFTFCWWRLAGSNDTWKIIHGKQDSDHWSPLDGYGVSEADHPLEDVPIGVKIELIFYMQLGRAGWGFIPEEINSDLSRQHYLGNIYEAMYLDIKLVGNAKYSPLVWELYDLFRRTTFPNGDRKVPPLNADFCRAVSGPNTLCMDNEVIDYSQIRISARAIEEDFTGEWQPTWPKSCDFIDYLLVSREGKDYKVNSYDFIQQNAKVNNGELRIWRDRKGSQKVGTFRANQSHDVDAELRIPTIGDAKVTIKDSDDNIFGEFTCNQRTEAPVEIVIPSGDGGGPVHWDDIEGKPCLVECPDCVTLDVKGVARKAAKKSAGVDGGVDTAGKANTSLYVYQTPEVHAALDPYWDEDWESWRDVPVHGLDSEGNKIVVIAEVQIADWQDGDPLLFNWGDDTRFDYCYGIYVGDDYSTENLPPFKIGAECGSGGGGLDDILNAPVVKGPTYEVWEDMHGLRVQMDLTEGDGKSGSTFRANTGHDLQSIRPVEGQASIDGYVQYKQLAPSSGVVAHNNYADFADLEIKAWSRDKQTEITGDKVSCWAKSGFFRAYSNETHSYPADREYYLQLLFTNVNGDPEELWIDTKVFVYRAMRREEIDLTEMEELDAALKQKKQQAISKLKSGKTQ